MNEEERRIHKERRKRQKRRRKERKREEARQANIADRRKRIEKEAARIVKEQQTQEARASRKQTRADEHQDAPRKAPRLSLGSVKEINHSQVILGEKQLGSGTFGSCYLGSYRGLDVVVKQLKVKKYSKETQEDAETRVRKELIYEARIIN